MQERRISPRVVHGKISQAEYTRQKGIVETKLVPHFGSMKLAAVRKADVVRYIHDRTGKVSDGTIIKEANTLKKLLNDALDLDKIPVNPAQRAQLPQAPEGRTRYLEPDEWLAVFRACYSHRPRMIRIRRSGCSGRRDLPSRLARGAVNSCTRPFQM